MKNDIITLDTIKEAIASLRANDGFPSFPEITEEQQDAIRKILAANSKEMKKFKIHVEVFLGIPIVVSDMK